MTNQIAQNNGTPTVDIEELVQRIFNVTDQDVSPRLMVFTFDEARALANECVNSWMAMAGLENQLEMAEQAYNYAVGDNTQ